MECRDSYTGSTCAAVVQHFKPNIISVLQLKNYHMHHICKRNKRNRRKLKNLKNNALLMKRNNNWWCNPHFMLARIHISEVCWIMNAIVRIKVITKYGETCPKFNRYFRAFWTRRPATTPCKHHVYQIKKWIQEKILISNIRKAFEIK